MHPVGTGQIKKRKKKSKMGEGVLKTRNKSHKKPWAINRINSVMEEITLLLLLRVGVWIIEIRAGAKCGGTASCKCYLPYQ